MKKFLLLFVLALCLFGFLLEKSFKPSFQTPCPFCSDKVLNKQKFYETPSTLALYTHKPIFPGHCLIIPRRHVERLEDLSSSELVEIHAVLKKVDQAVQKVWQTSSYLVLQKNGLEAGQTVPHVHFHYIPRKKGEFSVFAFFYALVTANLKTPLSSSEIKPSLEALEKQLAS